MSMLRQILRVSAWLAATLLLFAFVALAWFRWQADRREVQRAADIAPRDGRFVKAADVDIFIQELGPANGQLVLFMHGSTVAIGAWLPELLAPATASRSEDAAAYSALGMPMVAIWGRLDSITPLAQGERLVRLAPNGKLVQLPRSGHIPQVEQPAEFQRTLLDVLGSSKQTARPLPPSNR